MSRLGSNTQPEGETERDIGAKAIGSLATPGSKSHPGPAQLTLGEFSPPIDPEKSQYFTPPKLARCLVDWARLEPGMTVLEPSVGSGALVREILRYRPRRVVGVDIDTDWLRVVARDYPEISVIGGDFLKVKPQRADVAVMNPPLNGGEAMKHVRRALAWCPVVVTLLRTADLHGDNRFKSFWSSHDLHRLALLSNRPHFGGAHTAKADFVVAEITRATGDRIQQSVEHWPQSWA